MAHAMKRFVRRIASDCTGTPLVEFAIAAPFLATMVLGMADFSMLSVSKMSVEAAARAGAQYAIAHRSDVFSASATGVAVTSATGSHNGFLTAISATPEPEKWYGCVDDVNFTVTGKATDPYDCANGVAAGTYVTAHAQATYTYILPWRGLSGREHVIVASQTVRIG